MKATIIISLVVSILFSACSPKTSPSSGAGNTSGRLGPEDFKNIDWELFDQNSTVAKNEIKASDLQGLWKAYQGAFIFGGSANTMNLTQPFTVEFREGTYRRSAKDTFHAFSLKENILYGTDQAGNDVGIINQISPTVLTISWKVGANYTRYYYKK